MSIAPELLNGGSVLDPGDLAAMFSNLERRVNTLETSRTVIDAGTIEGTGGGGAGHIKALSVDTPELHTGSVTADRLAATIILASAITLNGGGYLETSASNPKVRFDANGVRAINASGVTAFDLRIDGRAVLGNPAAARTEMDPNGIIGYNSSSVEQVRISATDGKIYAGGTTGARVELDRTGIRAVDASAVEKLRFDTSSGNLTLAGALTANTGSAIPVTYVTSGNIVSGTIITIDSGGRLQTSPPLSTTTTGSHTLPVATINVTSTTGFASAGTIVVGTQTVTYTGKTGTTFTGCTGGTGVQTAGTAVVQRLTQVILDAAGVRAYDTAGVNTVDINSSTGNITVIGGTITGSVVRTAATGARVQMVGTVASGGGTNAFEVYDSSSQIIALDGTNGLVVAAGTGGTFATPWTTAERGVSWTRSGTGVAIVKGYGDAGGTDGGLLLGTRSQTSGGSSSTNILAAGPADAVPTTRFLGQRFGTLGVARATVEAVRATGEYLGIQCDGASGSDSIKLFTNTGGGALKTKILLAANGTSDFARLASTADVQFAMARCNGFTGPTILGQTGGITAIARVGVGQYNITHPAAASGAPIGVASSQNGGTMATCVPQSATVTQVVMTNSTPAFVDSVFTFVVALF